MKISELERERIAAPELSSDLCPNLAEDALDVLGYAALKENSTVSGLSKLQQVLAEKEIEVLKIKQVEVYKAERWHQRQSELFAEHLSNGREHLLGTGHTYWSSWPTTAAWTETEINKYKEAIPVHVLYKAVEIKRALPDAQIIIEHLTESQDPFLVIKHEGKKVYIDVWEEPSFEEKI